ncbi:uncharacterized protein LOC128886583 [Hylaeus anthracinus]|uniref:uncharacterized protein LOC128886583 n=1 Tax=Hylaeus anthracinus TaxID=313031 RepID=UPI0023BA257E|nr:uncharacterized protein LOC128886583 [Hylaeus anthracinus]
MSKSRSRDEKDREKDKETAEQTADGETRDTIEENEEGDGKEATKDGNNGRNVNDDVEDNARGPYVQLPVNQSQLTTEPGSNLRSPVFASNSLMVRSEPSIRSSPPPSYQHVIEQRRLEHVAEAQENQNASQASGQDDRRRAPKILHKSSKQFYRAMAKQWGITCKMSDHCRCLDCQSRYFDCEYETNENQKTDGGLGAGTPMFISEVIHGSACVLL